MEKSSPKFVNLAMSGTPSISSSQQSYNIIGRRPPSRSNTGLSLVLCIRGRKYQLEEDIRRAAEWNKYDVIVILPRDNTFAYDALLAEFEQVRLLLYDRNLYTNFCIGGLINAAISEADGELVFVVWNSVSTFISSTQIQEIDKTIACHLPLVQNNKSQPIPSLYVPAAIESSAGQIQFEAIPIMPSENQLHSLFPYDYSGIYSQNRFRYLGGFDESMTSPYWQKLEFGLRAWLWGEKLIQLPGFTIQYSNDLPVEEVTKQEDFLRFYLRIMAVSYLSDRAVLRAGKFWKYLRLGSKNIFSAWKSFKKISNWVRSHAFNYQCDLAQIIQLWEENL